MINNKYHYIRRRFSMEQIKNRKYEFVKLNKDEKVEEYTSYKKNSPSFFNKVCVNPVCYNEVCPKINRICL